MRLREREQIHGKSSHAASQARRPLPVRLSRPPDALARLRSGNNRCVDGNLTHGNIAAERRRAFAAFQAPFATVLSCSDSRVPPELIFDQNLGDLFIVRVAGNFADAVVLGTLEYAYDALHAKLIVVLGHAGCGAIKATVDAIKSGAHLPPHLDSLQNGIAPGIASIAKTGTYCVRADEVRKARLFVSQRKCCAFLGLYAHEGTWYHRVYRREYANSSIMLLVNRGRDAGNLCNRPCHGCASH